MVYYAQKPGSTELCALKHVIVLTPKDKRFYEQLRTEYLIGRHVQHPGLRKSIDMRVKRNWMGSVIEAALILEFCDGYSLEENVPLDPTERICVFLRAAMAIAALNDMGFVHCDIKPGNILVRERAQAAVIDLGQACKIGTAKQRIQGTPNYMAPEQSRREELTEKTDVFCFGATLYSALTRQPLPTLITSNRKERQLVIEDMIPAPHTIDQNIPEDLSWLIMECVRTRPERRPADMHQVVKGLRACGMTSIQRMDGET